MSKITRGKEWANRSQFGLPCTESSSNSTPTLIRGRGSSSKPQPKKPASVFPNCDPTEELERPLLSTDAVSKRKRRTHATKCAGGISTNAVAVGDHFFDSSDDEEYVISALQPCGTAAHAVLASTSKPHRLPAKNVWALEYAARHHVSTQQALASSNLRCRALLGRKLRKDFPTLGSFEGVVVDYSSPLFLVQYSDGEQEEMVLGDLEPLLLKPKSSSRGQAEAPGAVSEEPKATTKSQRADSTPPSSGSFEPGDGLNARSASRRFVKEPLRLRDCTLQSKPNKKRLSGANSDEIVGFPVEQRSFSEVPTFTKNFANAKPGHQSAYSAAGAHAALEEVAGGQSCHSAHSANYAAESRTTSTTPTGSALGETETFLIQAQADDAESRNLSSPLQFDDRFSSVRRVEDEFTEACSESLPANRKPRGARTSKYRGVICVQAQRRTTWKAQIKVDGALMRLGTFNTEESAARAYDAEASAHHENPKLNFPAGSFGTLITEPFSNQPMQSIDSTGKESSKRSTARLKISHLVPQFLALLPPGPPSSQGPIDSPSSTSPPCQFDMVISCEAVNQHIAIGRQHSGAILPPPGLIKSSSLPLSLSITIAACPAGEPRKKKVDSSFSTGSSQAYPDFSIPCKTARARQRIQGFVGIFHAEMPTRAASAKPYAEPAGADGSLSRRAMHAASRRTCSAAVRFDWEPKEEDSKRPRRWFAQINVDRKNILLGRYDSEEAAARAYDVAASSRGRPLNFPDADKGERQGTKKPKDRYVSNFIGVNTSMRLKTWKVHIKLRGSTVSRPQELQVDVEGGGDDTDEGTSPWAPQARRAGAAKPGHWWDSEKAVDKPRALIDDEAEDDPAGDLLEESTEVLARGERIADCSSPPTPPLATTRSNTRVKNWACPQCTLLNSNARKTCEVCRLKRPVEVCFEPPRLNPKSTNEKKQTNAQISATSITFRGVDFSSSLIETERTIVDGIDVVASGEQHVEWYSIDEVEIASFDCKRSWRRSIKVYGSELSDTFGNAGELKDVS